MLLKLFLVNESLELLHHLLVLRFDCAEFGCEFILTFVSGKDLLVKLGEHLVQALVFLYKAFLYSMNLQFVILLQLRKLTGMRASHR